MRALFGNVPTEDDLIVAGLTPEECTSPNADGIFYDASSKRWLCELWAENWPAIRFYTQISTQWRVGMAGPIGLDYLVVFHELDRLGLSKADYDAMMDDLRTIESEALTLMNAKA